MSLPESLSASGAVALEAILRAPSETLIATDFDGTLAPIVEDPARRTRIRTRWRPLAGSGNMSVQSW
jgi:hypothetical protein